MSVGLIALLDDVAVIAKAAAASLDDVATQAAQAGVKAAGVVIDDAAVTPRYVTGFSADRELPIIGKIALGSAKNKLLILLPAALLLSLFAPGLITPLLMIGGVYLCYEGTEKLWEHVAPHAVSAHEAELETVALAAASFEDQKVAGAIKTDFILSAEIMAITLAAVPNAGFAMQAAVLAAVGLGITVAVYGAVALIVKADDAGVVLARRGARDRRFILSRALGRLLVQGMPWFLAALGAIGTAAMIWVGGGIIVHGLEKYGFGALGHLVHGASLAIGRLAPFASGFFGWLTEAALFGIVGLTIGAATIPLMGHVVSPGWRAAKSALGFAGARPGGH
jgi:hypothetical protein